MRTRMVLATAVLTGGLLMGAAPAAVADTAALTAPFFGEHMLISTCHRLGQEAVDSGEHSRYWCRPDVFGSPLGLPTHAWLILYP